jgi:hypothetical protein
VSVIIIKYKAVKHLVIIMFKPDRLQVTVINPDRVVQYDGIGKYASVQGVFKCKGTLVNDRVFAEGGKAEMGFARLVVCVMNMGIWLTRQFLF